MDSRVPDAKTIRLFKERLSKGGEGYKIIETYQRALKEAGVIT